MLLANTSNNYQEIFNELKKAIACNPTSMQAYGNMGMLLIKLGKIDEGIVNLEKALKLDPHYVPTLERLGYANMKKGA